MSEITPLLSLNEARSIAAQCIGSSDFDVLNVHETPLGNEHGGFMSDYVILEIRVRLSEGTDKVLEFFSKTLPRSASQRRYVTEVPVYEKEVGFYRNLLPLLLKHHKLAEYTDGQDMRKWVPHCLLTRDDFIVMENLTALGFKVLDSRELIDYNHCVVILKEMARFHAATIIFEEKESQDTGKLCRIGDMYPEYFVAIIDRTMPESEDIGWFPCGIRALVDLVPHLSKYQGNEEEQKTIQEKLPSVVRKISLLGRSEKFRNVICHGDLWSSNILIRYGEDQRPKTVCFVDYQLIRYAPPAMDIMVFFHTTTKRGFREHHLNDLLKVYYDVFSFELKRCSLSANELLSFEELKESFDFLSATGRAISVMYYQMILADKEKKQSVFSSVEKYNVYFGIDRSGDVLESFENDKIYRCRVEEALEELIEKDILNKNDLVKNLI